jgi:hypothetical protein
LAEILNFKILGYIGWVLPVGPKFTYLTLNLNISAKNSPNFAYFISFDSPDQGLQFYEKSVGNFNILLYIFLHGKKKA